MIAAQRPMPPPDSPAKPPQPPATGALIVAARLGTRSKPSRAATSARLARRRWVVRIGKRLLPLIALALLSTVALWPELSGDSEHARMTYRRGITEPQSGEMKAAIYHGVDSHGRPYTMTAATARQVDAERIDLSDPKGDLTLEAGNWLMVRSRDGVYLQRASSLDLSGDVWLYRDDGTTMSTNSATLDLKQGVAAGAELTHAEGPFGVLDAQGFALTDKGAVIRFTGPGKLVLNAARSATPAAPVADDPELPPEPPVLPAAKRP